MTGPEHLAAAEELLAKASDVFADAALVLLRKAEVHAQIAQVMATIESANRHMRDDWYEIIRPGEEKPQ